jgi:hypothetical protein
MTFTEQFRLPRYADFICRARTHIFVNHRVVMDDDMHFAETSASLMSYPGDEDMPGSPSPRIGPSSFVAGPQRKLVCH